MYTCHRLLFTLLLVLTFVGRLDAQQSFWRPVEKPLGGNVFAVIMGSDGSLYAGTEWSGLFRSTDEGASWKSFGPASANNVYPVLVTSQGTIFIMTDDLGGIFRSLDDGATWIRAAQGATDTRAGYMVETASGTIIMTGSSGIYRTTDNAETWARVAGAGEEFLVPSIAPDGTIYAGSATQGLFHSTDDGVTWMAGGRLLRSPINALALSGNEEVIVGTDSGLFRSVDRGMTYQPFALIGIPIRQLGLGRLPGGSLIAATPDSGLFRLSPDGTSVTKLGVPSEDLYGLVVTPSGKIVLGYEGAGILYSSDEGSTFRTAGVPNGIWITALGETIDSSIYGVSNDGVLYRTADRGESFTSIQVPFRNGLKLAIAPNGRIYAAGSGKGAWKSEDGVRWDSLDVGTPANITGIVVTKQGSVVMSSYAGVVRSTNNGADWTKSLDNEDVSMLILSPTGELWGVGAVNLFHSSDDGATWSTVVLPTDLARSSRHQSIVSPASNVVLLGGSLNGRITLDRSTDGGSTWSTIPFNCAGSAIRLVNGQAGDLYASTSCDVSRSTDNGLTWTSFAPLPVAGLSGSLLADSRGSFWFGSRKGIYLGNESSSVPVSHGTIGTASGLRLFPNPSRGVVTVSFAATGRDHVVLSLRSLLGDVIAVLIDERLDAGEHAIHLDPALPSGAYVLQLVAGDRIESAMVRIVK